MTEQKKENTLDAQTRQMIDEATKQRGSRGFAIGLLDEHGEDVRRIEVAPVIDITTPPRLLRKHELDSTDSLLRFAREYADDDDAVIFINSQGATFVVDDLPAEGDRESAHLQFETHQVYDTWRALINNEVTQRDFLAALRRSESRLPQPDILVQASSLGFTGEVIGEQIDASNEVGYAIGVKVKGDERVEQLAKKFQIEIPVWRQDDLSSDPDAEGGGVSPFTVTINLRPVFPENGQGPLRLELWSEQFDQLMDKRVEAERAWIEDELKDSDILVLAGSPSYDKPRIGALS